MELAEPSPSPTPMTIEEAGAKYLELVAAPNSKVAEFNEAHQAGDTARLRVMCAETGTLYRSFADGLLAANWPEEAQSTVDKLVSQLATEIAVYTRAGATSTDDELWAALAEMPERQAYGQELRMILGLENVPTS
ncbi:hypothetical protein [Cellulomonas iranensis]|uniref:hypothetical protein n=1 Tax=Cellulomonas iranensis TaxID=76862 RepID=UPI003D7DBAC6